MHRIFREGFAINAKYCLGGSRGFTIIELMVVIFIAAVLMGIGMPGFFKWLPSLRLSSGARQIASDSQLARMKAISQNTRYRLNFQTASTYIFEVDNDSNGTPETQESGPFTLPSGITVTPTGPSSIFQPRGTADVADTMTVSNGTDTSLVCVKSMGRVFVGSGGC